jgi:hypothetical protein
MATNNAVNISAAGLVRYDGAGTFTGVTVTQYYTLVGAASNGITSVAPSATAGIPLVSGGSSANPSYTTAVVAGGGTGATSFNTDGVVISNTTSTGVLAALSLTSGQVVIGGTGAPAAATLTAGTGVSIANGNNSITISASGGGLTWTTVTGTSQAAAVNNGYIANNSGTTTVTLPATSAVGSVVEVIGENNATGWQIAQNAGNQIFFGTSSTTSGTGGYLASTNTYDFVSLLCITANANWAVTGSIGNITVH